MYLLFCLLFCPLIAAQSLPGSKQSSVCHSDLAFATDVFSVFINPAAGSLIKWRETGIYYSPSPFGLKELTSGAVSHNENLGLGSLTAGFSLYGYDLYSENKLMLSFSFAIEEDINIGFSGIYHYVMIKNYGEAGIMLFNMGTIISLVPELYAGFSIHNLTHSSFGTETDQIPMVIKSGLTYTSSDKLYLHLAIEKENRYSFGLSGGIEYKIFNALSLRTGFSTDPAKYSAGVGVRFNVITFDYSLLSHPYLGLTHQVGTIISFSE